MGTDPIQLIFYLFPLVSLGIALIAFSKLSTTPAGMWIGASSAADGLVSIASRVLYEVVHDSSQAMVISMAAGSVRVLLGLGLVIGLFLLPSSIEALASRSTGPVARW